MKFGVVGVVAFGIDYGLLVLLTEVFGANYLLSATISFITALAFTYVASMRFVFTRKTSSSRAREMALFLVLAVIGLGLNDLIMWSGVQLHFDYRLVKFVASAIVMTYNFVTRKLLLEGSPAAPA